MKLPVIALSIFLAAGIVQASEENGNQSEQTFVDLLSQVINLNFPVNFYQTPTYNNVVLGVVARPLFGGTPIIDDLGVATQHPGNLNTIPQHAGNIEDTQR